MFSVMEGMFNLVYLQKKNKHTHELCDQVNVSATDSFKTMMVKTTIRKKRDYFTFKKCKFIDGLYRIVY